MRALVTGASGFIGAHVVTALIASGADVRAFDRRRPVAQSPDAEFVQGDLLDRAALRQALAGCDAVFHLAALYSYSRAAAATMQRVNVEGTRLVIEEAAGRRLIHTSSCATCGPVAGRAATESDRPADWELRVPYKRTKVDGERMALDAAARGSDVVIVNPTTPVGPGDHGPTPTGKMVADVASGRARAYLARSGLNVVAVEDVARGHLRAFELGRAGQRYLLGGENLPMRDIFGTICEAVGRPAPKLAVPWPAAYGAAWIASRLVREPRLLVLDEVRVARWPMLFDDSLARAELGYSSEAAVSALARAARAVVSSADHAGRWLTTR